MPVMDTLRELGIELPAPPPAAGAYAATVQVGDLLFTSGQIAASASGLIAEGRLGAEIDVETGQACARQCLLNVLAQIDSAAGGLDQVDRVVKLTVFVASAPGFTAQPSVADGASRLLLEVLGDAGRHTRSAVGVAELPLGSPVEIEAIVELSP
jgi:enamine deaminase RidA (YjgF/YER057c/UK114 family)